MARQELPVTETRGRLRDLVAPLRQERETLVARMQELSAELAALRGDLIEIDAVLRRLDPDSVPQKEKKPSDGRTAFGQRMRSKNHARVLANVREYASEHPEMASDGFTITQLEQWLRRSGKRASTSNLHPVLDELRESGEIRLDSIIQGGGKLYKFVSNGSIS